MSRLAETLAATAKDTANNHVEMCLWLADKYSLSF